MREKQAIEQLWKSNLITYSQDGLKDKLTATWPMDRNVVERISYRYPPTFQPGYVGRNYLEAHQRVVIVSQNPGEGSDPVSQNLNLDYRAKLEEFAAGRAGWKDLSDFIASQMLQWKVFRNKGIFLESGDDRIELLPTDLRPSIYAVSYVNAFPFKTVGNRKPLRSPFRAHVWQEYVQPLIELLRPTIIVRFPESDDLESELRSISGVTTVTRVWHPSDYNVNTRPAEVQDSWQAIIDVLRGSTNVRTKPESKLRSSQTNVSESKKEVHEPKSEPVREEDISVVQRGECVIKVLPITPKRFCLEVYNGDDRIGEYERSGERDIERKKDEIRAAFNFLLDVYEKHGEWVVRWDGTERRKSVRVEGQEVAILPEDYWGRPSWKK